MGAKGVIQCFLWFILLSNLEHSFGFRPYQRWSNSKACPTEDNIEGCSCTDDYNLRHVKCYRKNTIAEYVSRVRKMELPKNTKLDLEYYELGETQNDIPSKLYEGLNVQRLEFHKCNITKWSDELGGPAFVGLEDKLTYLIIRDSIHRTESSFSHRIEKFEFSLSHLRQLTFLEMHDNTLEILYPGLFNGDLENSLVDVELPSNRILMIADGAFSTLRKLKYIDVSENEIRAISSKTFGGALERSLEEIKLKGNRISMIADDAFSNLKKLKSIDLSYNQIKEVSRSMFPDPALKLKEINLRTNKIIKLPEDIFKNMPALSKVVVSNNKFTNLPENTWSPVWSQLDEFAMSDVTCDDETLTWMAKLKKPSSIDASCRGEDGTFAGFLGDKIDQKKKEIQITT